MHRSHPSACHVWYYLRFQMDRVTTEGDVYQFVAHSFRAFDRAVYAKTQERYSGDLDRFFSGGATSHLNDSLPWEVSEAIAAVLGTIKFEPLRETVDR